MKIKSGLAIAMLLMAGIGDALPNPSQKLYGAVYIDGSPAKDGTNISAVIDNIEYALTTTVGGKYGYNPPLFYIPGNPNILILDGTVIKLYVNGVYAKELNFESMSSTQLDLSITTGSPQATFNKPAPSSGGGSQVENPNIPPPPLQGTATEQSTNEVQQTAPIQTPVASQGDQDKNASGMPKANAIDGGLTILLVLVAMTIIKIIRYK
jgi:hypothetical protein